MPNITIEYSSNILEKPKANEIFPKLHELLKALGSFNVRHLKSRLVCLSDYYIGEGDPSDAFVRIELSILEGRELAHKQKVSAALLEFLKENFQDSRTKLRCSLTVEISELDRETFSSERNS